MLCSIGSAPSPTRIAKARKSPVFAKERSPSAGKPARGPAADKGVRPYKVCALARLGPRRKDRIVPAGLNHADLAHAVKRGALRQRDWVSFEALEHVREIFDLNE